MGLRFLLDENLRGRPWAAIRRHNLASAVPLGILCVGTAPAPPLGTDDPELLLWCESNSRILVTNDRATMPLHLRDHLRAGHHSPGVFMVRQSPVRAIIEFLELATGASDEEEWHDAVAAVNMIISGQRALRGDSKTRQC